MTAAAQQPPQQPRALSLTIVGMPGGPWSLIDTAGGHGGITMALGTGDQTRDAMLGLIRLAGLATRVCSEEQIMAALTGEGQPQPQQASLAAVPAMGPAELARLAGEAQQLRTGRPPRRRGR